MIDNKFNSRWEIIEMDAWDKKSIDLVEPGYIEFGNAKRGSLHFICIYADINYQINKDNKVIFSFQGDEEGNLISGRGFAKIKNGNLHGRIFIHNGDESNFTAKLIGTVP